MIESLFADHYPLPTIHYPLPTTHYPLPTIQVFPVIEFLCPNGHRIRCQAEQAGRAAKCPRCGVKFRVPDAADLNIPEAGDSDPNVSRPEFTDSGFPDNKLASVEGGIQKEPQIEFLCPNGHRLFGPSSLQGKPGECPECGSRFRIPTYDEGPGEEQTQEKVDFGQIEDIETPKAAATAEIEDIETPKAAATAEAESRPASLSAKARTPPEVSDSPPTISSPGPAGQSIAALFARLWNLRPKDAAVELRLRDGETIVPHQFLEKASRQNRNGVFVVKEADENLSLVVVAWDAVARATVRGLKEVPQEWAE